MNTINASHRSFIANTRAWSAQVQVDLFLIWVFMFLLAIGLVMVYSASITTADPGMFYGSTHYLLRQSSFLAIGIVVGIIAFQIPIQIWQKYAPHLFILGVFLLIVVLIPNLGVKVHGSRRWLPLYIINFQPSELMKLLAVLYAASYTVRKAKVKDTFMKAFLPMFAVMAVVGGLLLLEPDMGAFIVICTIALGTLWLGGFSIKVFAALIIALPPAFAILIMSSAYRMQRVAVFLNPWSDPWGKGYQLTHSLIAFGRGEWLGVGLGASVEKLQYLPEAHTDFLMAVIAEELGLVGVTVVLVLFAMLLIRAFQIGRQAAFLDRNFSALTALGIGVWIGSQTIINIGVNMGVLPTKGLTLPFLSFGGSGLVINCIAAALLLRIDFENRLIARGLPI